MGSDRSRRAAVGSKSRRKHLHENELAGPGGSGIVLGLSSFGSRERDSGLVERGWTTRNSNGSPGRQ